MPYAPLYQLLPEVAAAETRSIIVLRPGDLPLGSYGFIEMFCDEEGCDCRRVFVQVYPEQGINSGRATPLATISFGWEDESFYRKWASFPLTEEDLHELKGPALVRLAPQSQYAPALLQHFEELIEDETYVARIIRHYQMFRAEIEGGRRVAMPRVGAKSKPGMNQPCPCGSGKKFKKCCWGKEQAST